MKQKAPTLRQFQAQFPTEDSCLDHLFQVRYGTDFNCPKCERPAKYSRVNGRRAYQCNWCAHQLYPTAGTPFDRTRTPLTDWFFVMFQFCTSQNGVAAKEVERQLGVTYKTAWRMCHEIRKYMGVVDGDTPIGGFMKRVEIDETFIGGRKAGDHGSNSKKIVVGMMEENGNVITEVVSDRKKVTLTALIKENLAPHTEIHTDEFMSYKGIGGVNGYWHKTMNHGDDQYVTVTGTTINAMESYWSQLKRGINGTHIHVSEKHLPKYLAEFEYRHNIRRMPHLMLDRLLVSFAC